MKRFPESMTIYLKQFNVAVSMISARDFRGNTCMPPAYLVQPELQKSRIKITKLSYISIINTVHY